MTEREKDERDMTEELLTDTYESWVRELAKYKPGSPDAIVLAGKVVRAKRDLDEYLKTKKK